MEREQGMAAPVPSSSLSPASSSSQSHASSLLVARSYLILILIDVACVLIAVLLRY
jgi:hypothetical protein